MAERPWVLPKEVKEYTEIEAVQNRSKARLEVDIVRAEQYAINYTYNLFDNCGEVPSAVKTAVILLTEAYASYSSQLKKTGGGALKSETFDDYSYTAGESTFTNDVKALDLSALLDDFVITKPRAGVTMCLWRL